MLIKRFRNFINQIGWRFYKRKLSVGKNSNVGIGYEFVNPQNIFIGTNFKAYKNLKLQTWPRYHGKETGYEPKLIIGDNVSFMDNVQISCMRNISIGNGVLFGDNVLVVDNYHGNPNSLEEKRLRPLERPLFLRGNIIIEDNVWVGRNVCIFGGVRIGSGTVIGANSVVTNDIPAYSIAVGAPARVIKTIE